MHDPEKSTDLSVTPLSLVIPATFDTSPHTVRTLLTSVTWGITKPLRSNRPLCFGSLDRFSVLPLINLAHTSIFIALPVNGIASRVAPPTENYMRDESSRFRSPLRRFVNKG